MRHPDPLPYPAVELLFDRLMLTFGHHFRARWAGMDMDAVKEDWQYQLAGVTPAQIDHALANLPGGEPPDARSFRALCASMPAPLDSPRLPPPRGPLQLPPTVRQAFERLRQQDDDEPMRLRWARRYVERFGAEGQKLRPDQRQHLERARRILRLEEHADPA